MEQKKNILKPELKESVPPLFSLEQEIRIEVMIGRENTIKEEKSAIQ